MTKTTVVEITKIRGVPLRHLRPVAASTLNPNLSHNGLLPSSNGVLSLPNNNGATPSPLPSNHGASHNLFNNNGAAHSRLFNNGEAHNLLLNLPFSGELLSSNGALNLPACWEVCLANSTSSKQARAMSSFRWVI